MSARRLSGSFAFGLVIIGVGVTLLLGSFGVLDSGDLFQWIPSLFIVLGAAIMIKNRFRQIGGPVLMIIVATLVQIMILGADIGRYWPLILVAVGAVIIIKSFRSNGRRSANVNQYPHNSVDPLGSEWKVVPTDQDSINVVSVMGSSTQKVVSPGFRGGRATAVMGEANIDLRESSIQEKPAVMEISVVMGEVNLRVSGEWNTRVDDNIVMGELKDERARRDCEDGQPDLVIKGHVVMGSLKIED